MTMSDEEAVAYLLGLGGLYGPSNHIMEGLPGADLCPHRMLGSGRLITEADGVSDATLASWYSKPYRHHTYVREPRDVDNWCKCGNEELNPVHNRCDIDRIERKAK